MVFASRITPDTMSSSSSENRTTSISIGISPAGGAGLRRVKFVVIKITAFQSDKSGA